MNTKHWLAVLGTLLAATGIALWAAAADPRPHLLVVGLYHMDNPERDAVNMQADDVLAPARQREVERVAELLAAYRPTQIAVEWPAAEQPALDARFAEVAAGRAARTRNEVEQLGFRVAHRADLAGVLAIDWNEMPAARDLDALDYEAFAAAHGQQERLDATRAATRRRAEEIEAIQRKGTILDVVRALNQPAALAASHRAYLDYALLGAGAEYPGAEWVQYWYGRNLKIFANLCRAAAAPRERVLVLVGAGHAPLLREFAAQSGRFTVEDPLRYLGTR